MLCKESIGERVSPGNLKSTVGSYSVIAFAGCHSLVSVLVDRLLVNGLSNSIFFLADRRLVDML